MLLQVMSFVHDADVDLQLFLRTIDMLLKSPACRWCFPTFLQHPADALCGLWRAAQPVRDEQRPSGGAPFPPDSFQGSSRAQICVQGENRSLNGICHCP